MKVFHTLGNGVSVFFLFSVLTAACVNRITEETTEIASDGNIPLKFIAGIQDRPNTRVAGNRFEEGDEVGLFALAGSTTMQEERYADNLCFVRSSAGEFISSETVYYPDDGVALDLISYYPYQETGVAIGQSTLQVGVESNQSISANYSHSDFLIASRKEVVASKEAIALTYDHHFFRLKMAISPSEGESIENMLGTDPQLSVCGFYTKALYDFQKDIYSGYSEEESILSAGQWEIQEDRLVGKEVILIPQKTTVGYQYIVLEVGGKTYRSLLPSTLELQKGKQRELEITFVSSEDILMSKVDGEIGDWEGDETDKVESEAIHKYIDVSKLTFEQSNVYKILHAGKQVAEICKEYLVASDLSSQAIVAYPMKADHTVNLSNGTVVQLLGEPGKVHGGNVSWNAEKNLLSYTPGTSAARNYVYLLADGQISLSVSKADEALMVLAQSDVIRDVRGGTIHDYPIVKIGTQYWMRSNLEATLYRDGTTVPKLTAMSVGATGYLLSNTGYYFYSVDAVLNHSLLPENWSAPDWEDWNVLKAYLKENASLLKSGKWIPIVTKGEESEVAAVNNLSAFNGLPVGMYLSTFQSDYEGKYVSYWTLNETGTGMAEKIFLLRSDVNEIMQGATKLEQAYAIRCIRK